jgi:hypothetical protein
LAAREDAAREDARPLGTLSDQPGAASLRWERRRVTLVRVRLIPREGELGSTETSRSMETIVDKVRCFGGHVAELGSTSVIAAFGLDPLEDAPRHAVSAAMAIQKVVGSGGGNPAWYPTVTIHTAPVPVGRHSGGHDIDAEAKPALVAVLEALAARTEPGTVVLSGEAAHFLGRRFELRHLTSTDVGQAYHVVGPIDTERRVATSFVGREAELGLLQERFRQAKTGHGQIVSVVGEPGIGKSRLLGEFRRQLAGEGTWMEGQASSVGRMIGLHPLVDLLRRTFRIEESDPDGVVVDKIEHGLVAVNEDLRPTIGFVRYLLSLDPGDPAIGRLDPQLRRASIFEAMQRFFARTAETRPLVIVWEDLHWADQATEELVVQLADSLVAHRILMIITGRPGYIPPASHRTFHTRLALSGLSPAHSVAMARALMSVDEVPARLQALLSDRAEGNPFFLEELLHSFQETGAIRRDGDDVIRRPTSRRSCCPRRSKMSFSRESSD